MSFISKSVTDKQFLLNMSFTYFGLICYIMKLQNCSFLDGRVIATKMSNSPLSLVHLIYTAGDKCMRQNACYYYYYHNGIDSGQTY